MKRAPAIDTLRYAQRLAETGMNRGTANVMAQALNEELEDRLLTKADLAQALAPIHAKLAEVDQRFEAVDAKIDSKVEMLGAQVDARFDAQDAKINALDAKVDARFDSLFKCMAFGFSTMFLALSSAIALGVIHFERHASPAAPVPAVVEQPAEPQRGAGAAQLPGAAVERPAEPPPGR